MVRRILTIGFFLSAYPPNRLSAQCPDGTPPPCRVAPVASARRDPPLDQRTWLVLPFENTARDTSAGLIHSASVSLLYQEMSRWQDVRVISDERVSDLLQRAPVGGGRIGLAAATEMARRVGAGRLVIGNYVAVRGRANITATVYDVRGGQQVRVVREPLSGLESAAALDSLSASFQRISRGVLAIPAGAQAAGSGLGTSSIEAYRAYGAGIEARNRLRNDSATEHFQRAVALDSGFALARLRLSQSTTDTVAKQRHLQAAIRLSASLPPRERALVEGYAAVSRTDYDRVCASANALIAADSSAADGWLLLVRCYADPRVVVTGGTARLRGDPTRAMRASERAYALAPTSWDAVGSIMSVLQPTGYRTVCAREGTGGGTCPADSLYRVSTRTLDGDSVAVTLSRWSDIRHAPPEQRPEVVANVQQQIQRVRSHYERYAALAPVRTLNGMTFTALMLGDTASAARHLRQWEASGDTGQTIARLQSGLWLELATERPERAAVYSDSLFARAPGTLTHLRSLFGHFRENATTTQALLYATWRPILAGFMPPGFDTLEQRIVAGNTNATQRDEFLQITTLAAFHLRRDGPALDTAARHPIKRFQAWFARNDLQRSRAALEEFDRELVARHVATPDDGGWLFSAESHLELGDSAVALERLREFGRRWRFYGSAPSYILEQWVVQGYSARLWGRTWLLYGDVAMAARQPAEARRGYHMVLGMWQRGDPILQPTVERVRAALAQLN